MVPETEARMEINHGRFALKALQGDFANVRLDGDQNPEQRARRAIQAADPYLQSRENSAICLERMMSGCVKKIHR